MGIWIYYYKKDEYMASVRWLGRVRVYKEGAVWCMSRGAYRRICQKITEAGGGKVAFAGPEKRVGEPVAVVSWLIRNDGSTEPSSTIVGKIESVW